MLTRTIPQALDSWVKAPPGLPLLISGAPQTGKSMLARQVAAGFPQSLFYDLSLPADRSPFEQGFHADTLLDTLFFSRNMRRMGGRTLVFLANLHASQAATEFFLRFHCDPHGIHLAAGTFLDNPPGKPEKGDFRSARVLPCSFREFLEACGETMALEAYDEVPFPNYATSRLLTLFRQYTLTGGMPEAVGIWAEKRSISALDGAFEKILGSWTDALSFSGRSEKVREKARQLLQDIFPFAGERITFRHFGNMQAGSREVAAQFRLLKEIGLLTFLYPTSSTHSPFVPDTGRSPRLLVCDTGMVGYFSGIRRVLSETDDLNAVFGRQVSRQVIGQELAASLPPGEPPGFWVRGKTQSSAEVDFIIPFGNRIIPVVVRSGEPGRLRSLHQFMDEASHPYAVRLYAGPLAIRQAETVKGKKFFLLSLPYFLAGRIPEHLVGFVKYVEG